MKTHLSMAGALALTAGAVLSAAPVRAQPGSPSEREAPAPDSPTEQASVTQPAPSAPAAVEEVVVTATRRDTRLSDVPLAVGVIDERALKNAGTNDIKELTQLSPSLLISSGGSESNTAARIRGIGTIGDNPGLESSVAVFVDGVSRARTGVAMGELGDIERVEVLRGPQGTLFGRNASAGLIHVITAQPSFDAETVLEAEAGNYDHLRLRASTTGGLSDTLAGKIEGTWVQRDGFYEDVNTGYDVNDRDRYFLRGQLLFEPSSDLSLRMIADYARRTEDCCAGVYATDEVADGTSAYLDPANNPTVLIMQAVTGASLDGLFPSREDAFERDIALSPGRSYAGSAIDKGISAEATWHTGLGTLTSITAYRDSTTAQDGDVDYGYVDILSIEASGGGRNFETFSQELRLQGEAFGGRLDWLLGGYFSNEDLEVGSSLKFGDEYGAFTSCLLAAAIDPSLLDASQPGCLTPTGRAVVAGALSPGTLAAYDLLYSIAGTGDEGSIYRQDSDSVAVFTHNIFHLTDRLDLTVGLRYTMEEKAFSADINNTNTACASMRDLAPGIAPSLAGTFVTLACQGNSSSELNDLTLNDSMDEDELTGTLALSWKPADRWLLFGNYSTGYKAGGYNLDRGALGPATRVVSEADVDRLSFAAETVDAFELGVKFGGSRASASAIAFYQEFENFQLNTFDGTTYIVETINGCSADLGELDSDSDPSTGACSPGDVEAGVISQGLELEAQVRAMDELVLAAGWTYADTHYADDLVGNEDGTPLNPSLRRLPGEQLSNAPKRVLTASLTWTPMIGSRGLSGLVYVNSRTASDYNTGSNLEAVKVQEDYSIVNARLGLIGPDERWSVELWAQNLFDTEYAQTIYNSAFQDAYSAYLGDPRTYGLTVRGRF